MKLLGRFVRSTTAKVAFGVVVGAVIAVPASVWAVVTFTDVPTSHPFYREITAVADAGIARGFDDGTYRPGNNITRQAMAAFMERGVGRAVSSGLNPLVPVDDEERELAAVALDAGATGPSTVGFVHVSASVVASTTNATAGGCPCLVQLTLMDGNTALEQSYLMVPLEANGSTSADATSIDAVVQVSGDSTHRYSLSALAIGSWSALVSADATVVATYFPFSGDGDTTPAYELSCPKDDPWEQNDTGAMAKTFFYDTTTNAAACPSDPDWYIDPANVSFGETINVTVDQFTNAEGNIDVCLYRFGSQVACSTGTGNSEIINFPVALAGTYSIQVYLAADSGTVPGNTYRLVWSRT